VDVEGAHGERRVWTNRQTGFVGVDYFARVDTVVVWTQLSGAPGQEAELDQQARRFVEAQLGRVRVALEVGPTVPPLAQTDPPAIYAALLASQFADGELPKDLTNVRVEAAPPTANTSGPRAVGIVRVAAQGPRDAGDGSYGILYAVFPSVVESQEELAQFAGFAYAYVPASIASPSRCTSVGSNQNACAVLVGNVVIYGIAENVHLPFTSLSTPGPAIPGADDLARSGVAHLKKVLGGMPWGS
jgi:hypothetical protein